MAQVRFFAAAEELAGRSTDSRAETTLGELRDALVADYPGLGSILGRCAVLVAGARVDDNTVLEADVVVDVLPPFAGG